MNEVIGCGSLIVMPVFAPLPTAFSPFFVQPPVFFKP
jgi:hypothetical protein